MLAKFEFSFSRAIRIQRDMYFNFLSDTHDAWPSLGCWTHRMLRRGTWNMRHKCAQTMTAVGTHHTSNCPIIIIIIVESYSPSASRMRDICWICLHITQSIYRRILFELYAYVYLPDACVSFVTEENTYAYVSHVLFSINKAIVRILILIWTRNITLI